MARTKTCISSDVVRSDAFLSLSHEAQALYFQLNLEADGYGVVTSTAMLMRGCGFDPAALSELEESEFIIPLATESGSPMKVVRHWWEHNNFRGVEDFPEPPDGRTEGAGLHGERIQGVQHKGGMRGHGVFGP